MNRARKVVVIGPESTGKSTLSAALAGALGTPWVPEYARAYLETQGRSYEEADLRAIAEGQLRSEDELAPRAGDFLICDTDLHVVRVWSEARYGRCDHRILQAIGTRRYDAYLLTDIDVPWTDDPLREHPALHERHYFYHQYRDTVQQSGLPWRPVRGTEAERLACALSFIEELKSGLGAQLGHNFPAGNP